MENNFSIDKRLLWEYNTEVFDYDKSYFIVIERVVERGDLEDWIKIVKRYGKEKILQVVATSKQLGKRDKYFTNIFINSDFLYVS